MIRSKVRIAHRLIVAAAAIGAALFVSSAPAQAASWVSHQTDSDWCYDAKTLDMEGNGYANDIWLDYDNDCRYDTRQWNTAGHDNLHERLGFDMDENGRFEVVLADTNQRVGWELVYFDQNQDGYFETVKNFNSSVYALERDFGLTAVRLGGSWVQNPYL